MLKHSFLFLSSALVAASAFAADAPEFAREKAPAGAKVFIVSPTNGATVGGDVEVVFGVEGIALAPAADARAGAGHHHLLIDAASLPPLGAPIPNDANHKHYGAAQTSDTIHLDPGTHTLQLDLGDARHVQFDPPIVSPKITIHVK
ncbi:DUF4399 domain-containing protein [Dokdonella sp.]|jgi:hypothetical protein|uniref:DUF4399 domain-containing protein n=1 Tax=Dokdonella sp. TaxID=2291710 RepID=UPI0037834A47